MGSVSMQTGRGYPVLKLDGTSKAISTSTTPILGLLPEVAAGGGKIPKYVALFGPFGGHRVHIGLAGDVDSSKGPILSSNDFAIFATAGRTHIEIVKLTGVATNLIIAPIAEPWWLDGPVPLGSDSVRKTDADSVDTKHFAIPNDSRGNPARALMVSGESLCIFRPGFGSGNIHSPFDGFRARLRYPVFIDVTGFTHIAYTATAAAKKISFTPVEV